MSVKPSSNYGHGSFSECVTVYSSLSRSVLCSDQIIGLIAALAQILNKPTAYLILDYRMLYV